MDVRHKTALHPTLRRVAEYVRRKRLMRSDDRVLVAVSGGPDSVGLLRMLHELRERGLLPGLALRVAHVNYGLRGAESDQDEIFVRELCAMLEVPISCVRVRLTGGRSRSRQSEAREARYACFARLRQEFGLTSVATGHTADDQAETLLLWLLRGAGTRGLAGMPVMREGGIIRPLLGVTREQILSYLASHDAAYRSDATNVLPVYRRNRIRQEVLPLLRAFNPKIIPVLAREADILAADSALLDAVEQEQWEGVVKDAAPFRLVLDADRLRRQPVGLQRRLVRRALAQVRGRAAGLTFRHVEDVLRRVLQGEQGAGLQLPAGVWVQRDGGKLSISRKASEAVAETQAWQSGTPLAVPGEIQIGRARLSAVEGTDRSSGRNTTVFVADADRLESPLIVRTWKPGDWFCPSGMDGHRKKLQDFFVDQKVRRSEREAIALVVSPAGIVWVAGYRGDERFRPGTGTSRFVTLSLKEADRP